MKRITVWLALLCLLLCGCAEEMPEVTAEPPQQQTEPSESAPIPTGCYDADSEITASSGGAVRVFTPGIEDITGFAVMGSDILVFSGTESSTVTKLSEEELRTSAALQAACHLSPEDVSTQITGKGLSYYDSVTGEVVFLDASLREISRTKLAQDITGQPVVSADRTVLYYCTADAVYEMNLEDGISRLIKKISNPMQTVCGLLMDDSILACAVLDASDGSVQSILFVSTQTGETIEQVDEDIFVSTAGSSFYAIIPEGAMQAMLYGQVGSEKLLIPADIQPEAQWYLVEHNAALTLSQGGTLDHYDLETGKRTASLTIENFTVLSVAAGEDGGVYIFGKYNGETVLCLWDPSATPTGDETIYTSRRYTLSNPDTAGLEECQALASQIGQKHNIEVLIAVNATAVQPWEYAMETEYQVPLIRQELEMLDARLEAFPENFLATAAKGTDSGIVRILLVRSIAGTPESGNPVQMDGACFWIDENAYAAIPVGQTTDKTFYHTIFHVLETRIMSKSRHCYEWDAHNPEGFAYDYDYATYLTRTDNQYLEGDNRAFIDQYSMTFPREDRATIMAYAMTEGNAEYFQSEILQNKLLAICQGIRKAFGLEKSSEVYLWEQYLAEPLVKK